MYVELAAIDWHTLKVTMRGDLIVCDIDGTRLGVHDDTLYDAGQIGLWTKADAQTYFDNIEVQGIAEGSTQE